MVSPKALDIFITSTCYDLVDLRDELATDLTSLGAIVRRSEDPNSGFAVDPINDSIISCLKNVESSDVLLAIIDRRYGGILTSGSYAGLSATHAEIRHGRTHKKPILYFFREAAKLDHEQLRSNQNSTTRWVEPEKADRRKAWYDFVQELFTLPEHTNHSNWYDTFRTSSDLKPLVRRRLADHFPEATAALALRPDRFVRLFANLNATSNNQFFINFRNIGPGPAIEISVGTYIGQQETIVRRVGGLAEREWLDSDSLNLAFNLPDPDPSVPVCIFCYYENRYGDKYRLLLRFHIQNQKYESFTSHHFIQTGNGPNIGWIQIT